MSKIVRLTERDLTRLVKRVISEQSSETQQKLWNQLVQSLQTLNPKKRVAKERGHFIYAGENPLKTYETTTLTFNSGKDNEFNLQWPSREMEGGPHDMDRVHLFYTLGSQDIGGNSGFILLNGGTINQIKDLVLRTIKSKIPKRY